MKLEHVLRPIDVMNRSRHLRNSTVKYKFIFFQASSLASPSSLLKVPNISVTFQATLNLYAFFFSSLCLVVAVVVVIYLSTFH